MTTDPTPARVTLTDDERDSLAVAAFCAPDKEIMASLEAWLAAREAALRAQINEIAARAAAWVANAEKYPEANVYSVGYVHTAILRDLARIAGGEQA